MSEGTAIPTQTLTEVTAPFRKKWSQTKGAKAKAKLGQRIGQAIGNYFDQLFTEYEEHRTKRKLPPGSEVRVGEVTMQFLIPGLERRGLRIIIRRPGETIDVQGYGFGVDKRPALFSVDVVHNTLELGFEFDSQERVTVYVSRGIESDEGVEISTVTTRTVSYRDKHRNG